MSFHWLLCTLKSTTTFICVTFSILCEGVLHTLTPDNIGKCVTPGNLPWSRSAWVWHLVTIQPVIWRHTSLTIISAFLNFDFIEVLLHNMTWWLSTKTCIISPIIFSRLYIIILISIFNHYSSCCSSLAILTYNNLMGHS